MYSDSYSLDQLRSPSPRSRPIRSTCTAHPGNTCVFRAHSVAGIRLAEGLVDAFGSPKSRDEGVTWVFFLVPKTPFPALSLLFTEVLGWSMQEKATRRGAGDGSWKGVKRRV